MTTVSGSVSVLVDDRLVFPNLSSRTRDELLTEMAERLAAAGVVGNAAALAERLRQRERDGCTGLGGGVAIPHCRSREISEVVLAVGVSKTGIDFGAADGQAVNVVFLLLSPIDAPGLHLQALARLSRLARAPGLIDGLRHADSADVIRTVLRGSETPLGTAAI